MLYQVTPTGVAGTRTPSMDQIERPVLQQNGQQMGLRGRGVVPAFRARAGRIRIRLRREP